MRRIATALLIGALAYALRSQPAVASLDSSLTIPTFDLRTQLLNRVFSETGDESQTLAFAFRWIAPNAPAISLAATNDAQPSHLDFARYVSAPTFDANASHVAQTRSGDVPAVTATSPAVAQTANLSASAPVSGLYRGNAALPTNPPSTLRFDLAAPATGNVTAFAPAAPMPDTSGLNTATATVKVPVRVGHVNFQGRVEAGQSLASDSSLKSNSYGAGANFNVQAGRRALNVDVASSYERLTRNDTPLIQSSDGASTWQLSNNNLPVLVPAFADVSKHTLSAGLAVPVSRRLTAGVQYDTQHLLGGYGVQGINNLDASTNIYGARLTYQLPRLGSAITFSAKQYRYQDNLVPANTFLQTREDVNLTVKF